MENGFPIHMIKPKLLLIIIIRHLAERNQWGPIHSINQIWLTEVFRGCEEIEKF